MYVTDVYSIAQWLNAKVLSWLDSCHLFCCCRITNSSSGFAFMDHRVMKPAHSVKDHIAL